MYSRPREREGRGRVPKEVVAREEGRRVKSVVSGGESRGRWRMRWRAVEVRGWVVVVVVVGWGGGEASMDVSRLEGGLLL